MNTTRHYATYILGSVFVLLPAHGVILASHFTGMGSVVSGATTTDTGSLINFGQSFIGDSRSTTHMMNAGSIPAIVQLSTAPLRGDIDRDGDVDEDDYSIFAACMLGPNVEYISLRGCSQAQFDIADTQDDNDVDFADYTYFSLSFIAQ